MAVVCKTVKEEKKKKKKKKKKKMKKKKKKKNIADMTLLLRCLPLNISCVNLAKFTLYIKEN